MSDSTAVGVRGIVRRKHQVDFTNTKSKTRQQESEATDINTMYERATRGVPIRVMNSPGIFGDFTNVEDFKTMRDQLAELTSEFNQLPAHTRAYFDNDPENLVQAITDPSEAEQLREFGLIPEGADEAEAAPTPERGETAADLPLEPDAEPPAA